MTIIGIDWAPIRPSHYRVSFTLSIEIDAVTARRQREDNKTSLSATTTIVTLLAVWVMIMVIIKNKHKKTHSNSHPYNYVCYRRGCCWAHSHNIIHCWRIDCGRSAISRKKDPTHTGTGMYLPAIVHSDIHPSIQPTLRIL